MAYEKEGIEEDPAQISVLCFVTLMIAQRVHAGFPRGTLELTCHCNDSGEGVYCSLSLGLRRHRRLIRD